MQNSRILESKSRARVKKQEEHWPFSIRVFPSNLLGIVYSGRYYTDGIRERRGFFFRGRLIHQDIRESNYWIFHEHARPPSDNVTVYRLARERH